MHTSLCAALWMPPCAILKGRPGKAHSDCVGMLRTEAVVGKKTVSERKDDDDAQAKRDERIHK